MTADATAALAALTKASIDRTPGCADDDRFVAEPKALTDADRSDMASKCRTCPLLILCLEYATTGTPEVGFWAGRHWTNPDDSDTPDDRGLKNAAPVDNREPAPGMDVCIVCGADYARPRRGQPAACSTECRRQLAKARKERHLAKVARERLQARTQNTPEPSA